MQVRFLLTAFLFAASALAQVASFPRPAYFRETFSAPVTRVELRPPVRLGDFVVGGKLELSLRSYMELVLANNTDIAISRLTVETSKNALLRAFAPFDPLLTASFDSRRSRSPATDVLQGANTVVQLSQPARFTYTQTMQSGTQYSVNFFGQKTSSNSGFQSFNPALTSNFGVNFSQPLIRNRGMYVNRLPLMVARSRLRKAEYDLRETLLRLVTDAENAYWDSVLARENLRVQESALALAGEALKRAQRELELGAISPLDIFDPQQRYASVELAVSQARFLLQQREDALRRQIGADLDPGVRSLPIDLTETVMPATDAPPVDAEMAVERALSTRPDLRSALQSLDVDDLQIRTAKNALRPDLSLTGQYTSQGRGGTFYQRSNVFTEAGSRSQVVQVLPGGFGDALDQMFGFGFPVYSFGLTLRLPIKDRRAAADMADAVVQKRRDTLAVRNVEQQVRLEVLNAVNQVESSKASMKLAVIAEDLARKYLEGEQKKYDLGTSQIFFVLQAQSAVVAAESAVVQNSVAYRKNLLNLLRRTGELLDARGVAVD